MPRAPACCRQTAPPGSTCSPISRANAEYAAKLDRQADGSDRRLLVAAHVGQSHVPKAVREYPNNYIIVYMTAASANACSLRIEDRLKRGLCDNTPSTGIDRHHRCARNRGSCAALRAAVLRASTRTRSCRSYDARNGGRLKGEVYCAQPRGGSACTCDRAATSSQVVFGAERVAVIADDLDASLAART